MASSADSSVANEGTVRDSDGNPVDVKTLQGGVASGKRKTDALKRHRTWGRGGETLSCVGSTVALVFCAVFARERGGLLLPAAGSASGALGALLHVTLRGYYGRCVRHPCDRD